MALFYLSSTSRLFFSPGSLFKGEGEGEGEEEHCMECASMAAVGAAAAAAANARDGQSATEALAGGEAVAYTNPYACMLTPEKIQALEGHKNSAVAKRWVVVFILVLM